MKAQADAAINGRADDTESSFDSNGVRLQAGDKVGLIKKDLDDKNADFTARRGAAVLGISLRNNPEHIEGQLG